MSQTRVQLIGDSFDNGANFVGVVTSVHINVAENAIISGIATVGELSTPEIKTDVISNESGTGPIQLKEGAILPAGKNLSGNGDIIISGIATVGGLSASEIKTDTISNESGTGPIELKEGAVLPAGKALNGDGDINISGNVTIGGLLTYEDVTNIDSVGLITARSGIYVSSGGATIAGDVNVTGATTLAGDANIAGDTDFNGLLKEKAIVTAGKLSDNTDIYLENGCIHIFTTAESTTSTPSIKYNATTNLKDKMSVGESVVVTLITTANASAYSANITIDGDAVTVNWVGGSAPSGGGSSGVDIHTFTIIKVASSGTTDQQLTVIANHSVTS